MFVADTLPQMKWKIDRKTLIREQAKFMKSIIEFLGEGGLLSRVSSRDG